MSTNETNTTKSINQANDELETRRYLIDERSIDY